DAWFAEARRRVDEAIAKLPPRYREALVLRDLMELEYADVASQAGITEQNARARVHRARAALRRMVEGTAVIGPFISRGFRRATRWAPNVSSQLSNSGATADMVNLPARAGALTT